MQYFPSDSSSGTLMCAKEGAIDIAPASAIVVLSSTSHARLKGSGDLHIIVTVVVPLESQSLREFGLELEFASHLHEGFEWLVVIISLLTQLLSSIASQLA